MNLPRSGCFTKRAWDFATNAPSNGLPARIRFTAWEHLIFCTNICHGHEATSSVLLGSFRELGFVCVVKSFESSSDPAPSRKRGIRLWIPVIIIAVSAANIIRLQTMPELDALPKRFWSLLSSLAAVPFLLIWWLFLSRLRWRVRLAGLGVFALCVAALVMLVRIDGSLGTGEPIIVWSW